MIAVTGIGSDHMIGVQVDPGARVDLKDLESRLQTCLENEQPVYAVVAIIGSTEEGAVDPLRGILKLRQKFQSKGLSFLVSGQYQSDFTSQQRITKDRLYWSS